MSGLLNKSRSKKTIIHALKVNNKDIVNKEDISQAMNKYFVNIGHNIASNVRVNNLSHRRYLVGNHGNFDFEMTNTAEIKK